MIKNNLDFFLDFFLKKKFNFCESIDLNIVYLNKKKKFFNFEIKLDHSINDNKNFLFLSKINKNYKNIYIGNNFFLSFLKKEIKISKIFYNEENYYLIKNNNLDKKFCKKKFLIKNYEDLILNIKNNIIKIVINKNNFLNLKIGNSNFSCKMIKNNYFNIINIIKSQFNFNNIIIKNIYISTTTSKSYILR